MSILILLLLFYATRQSCSGDLYVSSDKTIQYGLRSTKFAVSRFGIPSPTNLTNLRSLKLFLIFEALKNSMLSCFNHFKHFDIIYMADMRCFRKYHGG